MLFSWTLIVFLLSAVGILIIVLRKLPELRAIDVFIEKEKEKSLKESIEKGLERLNPIKNFNSEKILKKFFLRLKTILSKSEKRIDKYLHRISHSEKFQDNYWKKIKKK